MSTWCLNKLQHPHDKRMISNIYDCKTHPMSDHLCMFARAVWLPRHAQQESVRPILKLAGPPPKVHTAGIYWSKICTQASNGSCSNLKSCCTNCLWNPRLEVNWKFVLKTLLSHQQIRFMTRQSDLERTPSPWFPNSTSCGKTQCWPENALLLWESSGGADLDADTLQFGLGHPILGRHNQFLSIKTTCSITAS